MASKPCYIVAVSGGVDSVVLLDMLASRHDIRLIVAHVDHGIRPESAEDAVFVERLAMRYSLPCRIGRYELGLYASEDQAREVRYGFLRSLAQEYGAKIVTAHHQGDIIETIAINLLRGTGWRGLAVMRATDVVRPFRAVPKRVLLHYAHRRGLEWREDSTNQSTFYLRNRVRRQIGSLDDTTKQKLYGLWRQQCTLAEAISRETARLATWQRYFYIMTPHDVAQEVLRATLQSKGISQTRPQLDALLLAIKTARPGSLQAVTKGVFLRFSTDEFSIHCQ